MKNNSLLTLSLIVVLAILLAACGSGTKLTTVSTPGAYTGQPFQKMMVLALAKNQENQKLFEDAFSVAVDQSGTQAIAASSVLPKDTEINRDIVLKTAQKEGIDCILVTHLIRVGKRMVDVPMAPARGSSPITDGAFYNYYPVAYSYTHYPDQETEQTYIRLKTIFYEVKSQNKLWSASSETTDPKSVDKLVKQLSHKVIKSLEEHGLIN